MPANITITTGTGVASYSITTSGRGPAGPPGADGNSADITAEAIADALGYTPADAGNLPAVDNAAVNAAIVEAPATSRLAMDVDQSSMLNNRLAGFRERLDTITLAPCIAFFGDSMVEAYNTNIKLRDAFHQVFGFGGYSYLDALAVGGAFSGSTDFTDWFKGRFVRISASGHMAMVNVDSVLPVEANTLKLYYVRKPGGGVFKVQTRKNLGTWTDEASYLTVSADGELSGQVISITKTDLRSIWDIRAVWVSGTVDIFGGALYDTGSTGARLAMLAAGSTDMVNWLSAPSAVSQPIIADIAPHLCVLSHLDGAAGTNSYQATWQDNVNTWAATSPTWLVIGPPVGSNDVNDAANAAQAEAQRTLANTRNDAFWDNRQWTNSTPAQAVARGFLYSDVDPHYTPLAQRNWIPLMLSQTGLGQSAYRGTASGRAVIKILQGPEIRKSRRLAGINDDYALEIAGDLDIGPPPGRAGAGYGRLVLFDTDGPTSNNDIGVVTYNANALKFSLAAVHRVTFDQPIGQLRVFDPTSTSGSPNGQLGTNSNPFQQVFLGNDIRPAGDTGNKTQNYTSGRIRIAAGQQTVTVTNSLVTANSRVIATLGAVDTTATSLAIVPAAGSFVITLNAPCTAEVPVNWITFQ
jgi:hypothetical protein